MQIVDCIIIGGGVVGLAVAGELARRFPGRQVALLERNPACGQETSSRSSEVIHAGIYYAAGSLKARLCVEGKKLLYDFCRRWDLPHRAIGKLIVAKNAGEAATLEVLLERGRINGVEDLQLLDKSRIKALEPHVEAVSAVWSPSTGIIDSHALTARLAWCAAQQGATVACCHEVTGINKTAGGYDVRFLCPGSGQDSQRCSWVVNCAGLGADRIAACAGIDIDASGYRLHFCKGEYFRLPASKGRLVSHLVYPPPYKDLLGLGIHITKSLDGMAKLGPNAFYIDGLTYDVDAAHAREFYEGVKDYLPFLECGDLQPDTSGIRPKLQAPGMPEQDFVIRHEAGRGLPGFVNLIGIESPGLTSCLAIARMVADMVEL
jgi:L-2-hydroxyglutarate oxidase LhgO